MTRYFKQIRPGQGDASHLLRERLAREEMGEAAYDEAVSHTDQRSFRLFGLLFILLFAVAVAVVIGLGL